MGDGTTKDWATSEAAKAPKKAAKFLMVQVTGVGHACARRVWKMTRFIVSSGPPACHRTQHSRQTTRARETPMKGLPTAMGHRRLTLLAMAVAALLAVDCAVAASKGASRGSSHRRVSGAVSGRPRRTNKDIKEEEWESREHAMAAATARRSSRSKPDRNLENKRPTSDRRRARPSSSSPSRSRWDSGVFHVYIVRWDG